MDTIARIPEPLATAILTAVFTGLVIFFLQKKIESSFAKKLDTFRTNLQKSLFEYQTKFAQHHSNRVETLETLYRKLIAIYDKYKRKAYYKSYADLQPVDIDDIDSDFDDFNTYLRKNGFYLDMDSVFEIQDIYVKIITIMIDIIPFLRMYDENDDTSPFPLSEYILLQKELDSLGYDIRTIKSKSDMLELVQELDSVLLNETEKLANLYKSVAEPKYEEQ